jgi:hypothetical protein
MMTIRISDFNAPLSTAISIRFSESDPESAWPTSPRDAKEKDEEDQWRDNPDLCNNMRRDRITLPE